ncbi:acyltransferase family protein [Burkholderia sp. Leaf177]|uniref:acyltransferase family protein n=1 Tax=Burkholderia sp. Leaf177 TaxID=1736287 RepID=UPI00138F65B4|nr:acyltransferase [Burkholderia sp. Leaf177]
MLQRNQTNACLETQAGIVLSRSHRRPIPSLTGLRVIACFLVALSHLRFPGLSGKFLDFERSGFCGVTFFFVLSGFVIAYNYRDLFYTITLRNTRDYLINRLARIYPLYLFAIIVAWWWHQEFTLPLLLYLLALQAWSPDVHVAFGINGAAWSIGVELFLYAAFPLLAKLMHMSPVDRSLSRLLTLAFAISAVMLAGTAVFAHFLGDVPSTDPNSSHRWIYRMPVARLGDFILGMIGGLVILRHVETLKALPIPWAAIRLSCCALVATLMTFLAPGTFAWDVAYAIPFAVLVVATAADERSRFARFFSSRGMVVAGETSYAFYLIHLPASEMWRAMSPPPGVIGYLAQFVFIALLAVGLHYSLERPAQRAIKRLFTVRRSLSVEDTERDENRG